MTLAEIQGGICGFVTKVKANSKDGQKIELTIETDCPNVSKLAAELKEVDAFKEVLSRALDTATYQLASKYCPHPGCPVPAGILKAIEVEAGLALPKDAAIFLRKGES